MLIFWGVQFSNLHPQKSPNGKKTTQEYFTPKQRAVARAVAFLTTIVLVVKFGDSMDMPENPKYAWILRVSLTDRGDETNIPKKSEAKSTQKLRKFGLGVGWRRSFHPLFHCRGWMVIGQRLWPPGAQLGPVLQKKNHWPLWRIHTLWTVDGQRQKKGFGMTWAWDGLVKTSPNINSHSLYLDAEGHSHLLSDVMSHPANMVLFCWKLGDTPMILGSNFLWMCCIDI